MHGCHGLLGSLLPSAMWTWCICGSWDARLPSIFFGAVKSTHAPNVLRFSSRCSILSIAGVNWQVTKAVPQRAVPRPPSLLPRSFLEHLLAFTMNLHSFEASGSPFCI
ncbi:unnamed protein product [Rangifer tarandus platyrhynchus]|uniref:Secreted protein n=2 Tax=Rangifer tarandus platyrhynchus TaxID=3082113 RepID=A0ABN8YVG8_RANTA|nr:unnamed protein product [Rangifer tarandus platyrhynchus]